MSRWKPPSVTPTGRIPGTARPIAPAAAAPADDLAALRATYVEERTRWETLRLGRPAVYRPPASYEGRPGPSLGGELPLARDSRNEWLSLLRWCNEREIPPEAYIRFCFESLKLSLPRPPEPMQLKSDERLAEWRLYRPRLAEAAATALFVQKNLAKQRLLVRLAQGETAEGACVGVCLASDLDLSPLFRYCLARRAGTPRLDRLASQMRGAALAQFGRDRAIYVQAWAEILPPELAKAARGAL